MSQRYVNHMTSPSILFNHAIHHYFINIFVLYPILDLVLIKLIKHLSLQQFICRNHVKLVFRGVSLCLPDE